MFYNFIAFLSTILFANHLAQLIFEMLLIFLLSFALSFLGINWFIKLVSKKSICRQPIRSDGPESHLKTKKNTPTMGGLFIIAATLISSLLFANLKNNYVLVSLFVMFSFAIIGLTDDYMKVTGKNSKGFRGSIKLIIQFLIVTILVFCLRLNDETHFNGSVFLPFLDFTINLGIFYVFFATFVIVGSANAVNLTDGLDGLVTVPAIITLGCFIFMICMLGTDFELSSLDEKINQNIFPLIMVCSAMIGSLLAFLKFNLKPAKIFMGDVGSYFLGFLIGSVILISCLLYKTPILFWLIIYSVFCFDSTATLCIRFCSGEKWYLPHRSHAYQKLQNFGWTHKNILCGLFVLNSIFTSIAFVAYCFDQLLIAIAINFTILIVIYLTIWFKNLKYAKNF